MLGCEAKQLSQQFETFIVHTTGRLEDHRSKLIRSAFEIVVIASVLLRLSIVLAGGRARNVVNVEGAGNRYVNCQTTSLFPIGDRNVARSPSWFVGITQDALLFHDWGQLALSADLVQQVADSIVTDDEIRVLCAACGVVAHKIEVLHAHRTIDFLRHNRNTEPNKYCSLEIVGLHYRVVPIES